MTVNYAEKLKGYTKEELLNLYGLMFASRKLDDKMLLFIRQGKGFFHIGSSGHEGANLAAAKAMKPGYDWFYPHYRDMALCLGLGHRIEDILLAFFSKKDDIACGGRQMPQHFGNHKLRIVTVSSPTGSQYLQAVGTGLAIRRAGVDEAVYVGSGEGTTSQGDFHEGLNWASREKAPVIFHVQDNGYAISVPKSENVAGGSVYDMVGGYANLDRVEVNGSDYFESLEVFQKAVERARRGEGPTVVVSQVPRLLPHSSSDDHRKYRSQEEIEADKQRDPLLVFERICTEAGVASSDDFRSCEQKTLKKIDEVAEWAQEQEDPDPSTATKYVFASWLTKGREEAPKSLGDKVVVVDALNHALHEEMEENPKMVVYGQDIADPKGGVFTVTKGLTNKFGRERAFNAPLAESSIVGTAIGMAVHGYKPVVEIQFVDYIWTAMMQIRNELATLYYRSNGAYKCPVVIRTTCGGYIHGGLCHSQSNEAFFTHMAGLRVFYPSNAADAKGLLKAAIRGDDPVLFLEHKALYRQAFAARPEPDADYILTPGIANILKEGEDLTVITWGMLVYRCLEMAKKLEEEVGGSIEVLDLRTLSPLDTEAILLSVQKTGKALVVHEDNLTGGFGGEIAAIISSEAFEYLDGPVKRVAAKDAPIPYSPVLEPAVLPQPSDIYEAMKDLLLY